MKTHVTRCDSGYEIRAEDDRIIAQCPYFDRARKISTALNMHADFVQCLHIILENPDNIIKTADRLFGEHLLMQAEESDKDVV